MGINNKETEAFVDLMTFACCSNEVLRHLAILQSNADDENGALFWHRFKTLRLKFPPSFSSLSLSLLFYSLI